MSDTSQLSLPDIVRDIFLWRKKKLSVMVLVVATAAWVVMDVYQYNFVIVASYIGMFITTLLFVWGNFLRLLKKEEPDPLRLEISEQKALEMANTAQAWMEEGVRWLFHVGAVGEWFTFAGTVAALWTLSKICSYFDLLTLLYIGTVLGMIFPVLFMSYEESIKRLLEKSKTQGRKYYDMVDKKVIQKAKGMFVHEEKKEKKME